MLKRFVFKTLGCKLNYSESSSIIRDLKKSGFIEAEKGEMVDLCIINTCSVTNSADRKSRQAINKIINNFPQAFIIVIGCYVQLQADKILNIPGVDLILGNAEKQDILKYISDKKEKREIGKFLTDVKEHIKFESSYSTSGRTRSFFKIQDGCDYNCSYCTIPHARGRSRSDTISRTIETVKIIAGTDIQEVVLSGVNVGDFGKPANETLFDLIVELDKILAIHRFRISSIEPDLLSDKIIDFVASSRSFVPHFHIPLQSGSDRILKLMKRRYNLKVFSDRIDRILSIIPNACIGADIITGFPGESENDFNDTYKYLKDKEISYLHIFSYSERNNTEALNISPKIKPDIISERSRKLQSLGREKKNIFYKKNLDSVMKVLFESEDSDGNLTGLTANYIKVEIPFDKGKVNRILSVKLDRINDNGNIIGRVEN